MITTSSQTTYKTKQWVYQFAHERPMLSSFFLMLIGVAGLVYVFFSIIPPPSLVTRERIKILENHIRHLKAQNPNALVNLQNLKDKGSEKISIMDGWNRPILYRSVSETEYELTSYGEDGVPGGKPDFIHHFTL